MRPATGTFNGAGKPLDLLREGSHRVGCTVDDGCAFVTSANGCLQVKYLSVNVGPCTTV
jgi:hypothetical protein